MEATAPRLEHLFTAAAHTHPDAVAIWDRPPESDLMIPDDLVAATCDRRANKSEEAKLGEAGGKQALPGNMSGWRQTKFKDLEFWSNQIARCLLAGAEVAPFLGARICISIPRSAEMVASVIGVLKTGSMYVPVDPQYPEGYTDVVIHSSKPSAVITTPELASKISARVASIPIIVVAALKNSRQLNIRILLATKAGGRQQFPRNCTSWHGDTLTSTDFAGFPSASEETSVVTEPVHEGVDSRDPDNLYVLFTSGSTGVPKGVVGKHSAAINRISWMHAAYPFQQGETVCSKTSLNFVDSVWEIFGALLAQTPSSDEESKSVPLVMMRDASLVDKLVDALAAHRVTRLTVVPSLLRAMLGLFPDLGSRLPALRLWITSGEALDSSLLSEFRRAIPEATLLNLYGSTEVAGDCTGAEFPPLSEEEPDMSQLWDGPVPIGHPIAGAQCWIDPAAAASTSAVAVPAASAVGKGFPRVGELLIGGPVLAQGYFASPEESARRFVARPDGSMVFRSGDLVRQDSPGGVYWFLGRVDNQVKIRGVRVELEAVEEALLSVDVVTEAAVIASPKGTRSSGLNLYGFVVLQVPAAKHESALQNIRERTRCMLPAAALPSSLIVLDRLLRTPNGKRDRKALEMMISSVPADAGGLCPSSTFSLSSSSSKTLNIVLAIVRNLLGGLIKRHEELGQADEFYALGGDSLSLVQLIIEIYKATGIRLRLGDLPPPGRLRLGWFVDAINGKDTTVERDLEQDSLSTDIIIRPLASDLVSQVAQLFSKSFVGREPLMVALGVTEAEFFPFAEGFCSSLLNPTSKEAELSFVALRGGQVVAYSLNEVFDPNEQEPDVPEVMMPAFAFLGQLDEAYFAFREGPPAPGTAMHMIAAGAHEHASTSGKNFSNDASLVLRLERAALSRARQHGFKTAFTTCTNYVTAVIAEDELGFTSCVTSSARSFEFDGKHVFASVADVHDQCAVFELEL